MKRLVLTEDCDGSADNPIVWQCGKVLPDGHAKVYVLHLMEREALVARFGEAWLVAFLAEKQAEIDKWGVH